jgi:hypothetical protein
MKVISILSILLKQKQIDVTDAKETMEFYNVILQQLLRLI